MAKFIELSKIDLRAEQDAPENAIISYMPAPTGEAANRFENLDYEDDLERPLPVTITYYPVNIAVEHIREFHPRKKGAVGTRIVFQNGAATIVKELFDEVKAKLNSFNN